MTLRIPNEGESRLLAVALGKTAPENLLLHLYSNNITPGETDTDSSYTEVVGHDYAEKTLLPANWTISAGNPAEGVYPQQEWIFSGEAGAVYGYYLTGATSGLLYWAERFTDGPYIINLDGDRIRVTPKITLQDTLD